MADLLWRTKVQIRRIAPYSPLARGAAGRRAACGQRHSPRHPQFGGKGYDSSRFRRALVERGIEPCIPSSKSRKVPLPYDKGLHRQRHRIENMFGRLKD